MPTPPDVTGLILAGGRSRRFGRDKAVALLHGEPLIVHVSRALAPHVTRLLVATGSTRRPYPIVAEVVCDPDAGVGPIAGLAAGLAACRTPWLLAVAVDLPYLTANALDPLLRGTSSSADVVVALDDEGRRQPVCARWRVATVQPVVGDHLARSAYALQALFQHLQVRDVQLGPGVLRNVNHPSDLRRPLPEQNRA